jgi:hypothetical protein
VVTLTRSWGSHSAGIRKLSERAVAVGVRVVGVMGFLWGGGCAGGVGVSR